MGFLHQSFLGFAISAMMRMAKKSLNIYWLRNGGAFKGDLSYGIPIRPKNHQTNADPRFLAGLFI